MLQLLLSNKANPNAKNGDGDTPAHIAAFPDKLDMFEALVQGGADLKVKNNDGKTASDKLLMESAAMGNEKAAKRAIELGANVNAVFQNPANWTPSHNAAQTGSLPVIDLLLKNGADITLKDSEGRTALHIAAAQGNSASLTSASNTRYFCS
jgi:ankyrin repeat protein